MDVGKDAISMAQLAKATVFCPKCGAKKRASMSVLRLFGTQKCKACEHTWTPPRQTRKD